MKRSRSYQSRFKGETNHLTKPGTVWFDYSRGSELSEARFPARCLNVYEHFGWGTHAKLYDD